MIKFEVWYDAYQTKIMACSSEETKENNNVECYYKVGKYIKKEIEDIQEENNKQKEVLDDIRNITKEILERFDKIPDKELLTNRCVDISVIEEINNILKGEE